MATVQEAIRRLTVQATSTGVDETTAKLRGLTSAKQGVTVAAQSQERATLSLERRLSAIQRQYDVNYRAEQALARVTRDLSAARAQGLISAQREAQLLELATARHRGAATATGAPATSCSTRRTSPTLSNSFVCRTTWRLRLPRSAPVTCPTSSQSTSRLVAPSSRTPPSPSRRWVVPTR